MKNLYPIVILPGRNDKVIIIMYIGLFYSNLWRGRPA